MDELKKSRRLVWIAAWAVFLLHALLVGKEFLYVDPEMFRSGNFGTSPIGLVYFVYAILVRGRAYYEPWHHSQVFNLYATVSVIAQVSLVFAAARHLHVKTKSSGGLAKFSRLEAAVLLLILAPSLFLLTRADDVNDSLGAGVLAICTVLGAAAGCAYARHRGFQTRGRAGVVAASTLGGVIVWAAIWAISLQLSFRPYIVHCVVRNDSAAIANLRAYATAQSIFRRHAWYGDEVGQAYANPVDGKGFADLYEIEAPGAEPGKPHLTDRGFAIATCPETPKAGYYYVDITGDANGPYDYTMQFGLCAVPAKYDVTGKNTLIIDAADEVYYKDTQGRPVTKWPDVEKEGWKLVDEDY